jgi:diguanylate cyclase (GGDEF)-like protein
LTDLPNRVLFADRLELALARTARDGSKVAVLFLDLDGFKGVNDTLGHAAGDELLHGVAQRIHGCLRPNDTLARYGGDEFVVLVEQIQDADAAIGVANRILEALTRSIEVADTELIVKTSIGIALTGSRPGADSDVLRRADIAMYEAKGSGGSCYVLSVSPDTDTGTSQRLTSADRRKTQEDAS